MLQSDADDDALRRLAALDADDEFFAICLSQAPESQEIDGEPGGMGATRRGNDAAASKLSVKSPSP